jgi:selenocysteine lyase/cysteine desulfurase
LYTPASPDLSAALVTFGLEGWNGEALGQSLRERRNIIIKPLPHTQEGLRASITFFTLEEEIDLLLEALREIY